MPFEIKEKDIQIKYGMINYGDERELAKSSFTYIVNDIYDLKTNYFRLGFHLNEFDSNEYYRDFGYSSLKEFLKANTDLEYSAAMKCMRVHSKFCKYKGVVKTAFIRDEFENFNYSQLVEMSSMKQEDLKDIKPDMSVKDIRAKKREHIVKSGNKNKNGDVAIIEQSEIENIKCVLLDDLDENKLDYFMIDLLDLLNKNCNRVLAQTSAKGKQAYFSYDGKKYKLQLCEVKE